MRNVESRYGPVIETYEVEGTREHRVVIGYRMGGTKSFFRFVKVVYGMRVRYLTIRHVLFLQCIVRSLPFLWVVLCQEIRRFVASSLSLLSPRHSLSHFFTRLIEQFSNGITIVCKCHPFCMLKSNSRLTMLYWTNSFIPEPSSRLKRPGYRTFNPPSQEGSVSPLLSPRQSLLQVCVPFHPIGPDEALMNNIIGR